MFDEKPKDDELGENLGDIFKEEQFENEETELRPIRRLQKVKMNSLIAGVCTGIASYFGIEPVIVRIIFIISIFFGGWGIVAYFLAAVLLPSESKLNTYEIKSNSENNYAKTISGSLFFFIGLYFIAENFGYTPNLFFFGISHLFILPLLLITIGVFLIVKTKNLNPIKSGIRNTNLYRSKNDRRLFGVCGGLADYLNIESNNLRMIWIILIFITMGMGLVIYLLMAILLKVKSERDIRIEIQ